MSSGDNERLAKLAAYSGDPWVASNPYFAHAESHMDGSWAKHIWPLISGCDFSRVVEIACGQGRNSAKLLAQGGSSIGLDIQSDNVSICQKRFEAYDNARFIVNNGYTLNGVDDNWATFVYTFDAMVHFEPDVVRSYVFEIARVLSPGGRAFLHHSNYTGGKDWRQNPASRNYMSVELMTDIVEQADLYIDQQVVIDWNGHRSLDCLTLLRK